MLRRLNNSRHDENIAETQGNTRISIDSSRQGVPGGKTSSKKKQIRDLEEEIEKLRATVRFYQDIILTNE